MQLYTLERSVATAILDLPDRAVRSDLRWVAGRMLEGAFM